MGICRSGLNPVEASTKGVGPVHTFFLICAEIRENKSIEGIKIGNTENKLAQFADDMDLYLMYKESVLREALAALKKFERSTGLKINYDKSVLYRIGSVKSCNAKFYASEVLKEARASLLP